MTELTTPPGDFHAVVSTPWVTLERDDANMHRVQSGTGYGAVVCALAMTPEGTGRKVALVRQYRPAIDEVTLELPRGGTADLGSDEAARELAEETGIVPDSMHFLGEIWPDTGLLTTRVAVWMAVSRGDVPATHYETETGARLEWTSVDALWGHVLDHRIRDAMSISAAALFLHHNIHRI